MIQDYPQLVEKISKSSGKEENEITRLIEAKRAKLSGLISREGAAQIVASELGVSFDKARVKINEINSSIRKINLVGKIVRLFPVREYKKENREGKIGSFILADDTGQIRTVLWDVNHISLIEKSELKEGDFVEISSGSLRNNNELHLSGFSDIKKSAEIIDNIVSNKSFVDKKIIEFGIGGSFRTRAFIVQLFDPKFFEVCPECESRLVNDADGSSCEKHGKVLPKRKALISIVLDDGTSSMRAVLFSDAISKMGLTQEELEPEVFINKKNEILGREAIFSGNIRQNKLFNNLEMFVSNVESFDLDNLIQELEK